MASSMFFSGCQQLASSVVLNATGDKIRISTNDLVNAYAGAEKPGSP